MNIYKAYFINKFINVSTYIIEGTADEIFKYHSTYQSIFQTDKTILKNSVPCIHTRLCQ